MRIKLSCFARVFPVIFFLGGINFFPHHTHAFSDVFSSHLYAPEIEIAVQKGILKGYADGTFHPDDFLTRSELVQVIANFHFSESQIQECLTHHSFQETVFLKDVKKSSWYAGAFCVAYESNIISGYSDKTFRGESFITLPEFAKVFVETFKLPLVHKEAELWYEPYIAILQQKNIILPSEINGDTPVTRAQIAAFFTRIGHEKYVPEFPDVPPFRVEDTEVDALCNEKNALGRHELESNADYKKLAGQYYATPSGIAYFSHHIFSKKTYEFYECFFPIVLSPDATDAFTLLFGSDQNLDGTYVKIGDNIFTNGKKIEGADGNSFKVMDFAVSKDKDHVYFQNSIFEMGDSATFEHVFGQYFRDKNHVYIHHGTLQELTHEKDGQSISADAETFLHLGDYFAKDKNAVYDFSPTIAETLAEADAETFEYLGNWFGKDKNKFFYRRWPISGVEFETAEHLGGPYLKDSKNVFCGGTIIPGADAKTFEWISDERGQDKFTIYENCKPLPKRGTFSEAKSRYFRPQRKTPPVSSQPKYKQRCENKTFPTPEVVSDPAFSKTRSTYNISAELDYAQRELLGSEHIRYVNQSNSVLDEILILLEPNRLENVFCLGNITWGNGSAIENIRYEGAELWIPLQKALAPGASVELTLEFQIHVPDENYGFGTSGKRQLRFVDWHPFVAAYTQEDGWHHAVPAENGEYTTYNISDFSVTLTTTGAVHPVIAAGGFAQEQGDTKHFRLASGRNFTWLASPDYEVLSRSVGDTILVSYTFPEYRAEGAALLDIAEKGITLFTDLFGRTYQPVLSMVIFDDVESMEYQNMFVIGQEFYANYDGTMRNWLGSIGAHETAHQWWYGLMGNDQAFEPWLDETFATYSEKLYYEKIFPKDLQWWHDFRISRGGIHVNTTGKVNSPVYDFTSYNDYVRSTYFLGVTYLDEIRALLGDEKFFGFFKRFAQDNTFGILTASDFFQLLKEFSSPRTTPASA